MIQKTLNVVNFRIEEKKQKFSVRLDSMIPQFLIGDEQRLAQVITNLLGNAVKFTPEGGSIYLKTRFLGEEDGNCFIEISITDTGIGLSREQQEKLFQPFQQADSSTVRKFGGTGLGLAISKNIMEMMGGKLWVESEMGKGATFAFMFPAKRGEDTRQEVLLWNIPWSTISVLAVDDDPETTELFRVIMRKFDASYDIALSGEEALDIIERHGAYSIYFVNWQLPDMDGIAFMNKLRQRTSTAPAVMLLISAAEWIAIEANAKNAGVNKFLSKPLFSSDIIGAISSCVDIGPNPASSQAAPCGRGNVAH